MTKAQQDKTVVIAKYDGWELKKVYPFRDNLDKYWFSFIYPNLKQGEEYKMQYHTSDDWIMPVARKVWQEFEQMLMDEKRACNYNADLLDRIQDFERSAFQSTEDLFESVYQAIILLQSIKPAK